MNGKDAIIAKIIDDAEKAAADVIAEAEAKAKAIIGEADNLAEEYRREHLAGLDEEKKLILERRQAVARLDVKKRYLEEKQNGVNKVMEQAERKLNALSDKEYVALITSMLDNYAEDGDGLIFSKSKEKLFDKTFVKKYAESSGKKVTFNGYGDFKGGMILTKNGIDKNLTFDTILQDFRTERQAEIAARLFDDEQ